MKLKGSRFGRRASGILLPITSLPSRYGIGDLGPWAYRFIDFLAKSRQSYWQILPLNPTSITFGNSPYSSFSAFAGNSLLISPDLLLKDGYLSRKDLNPSKFFSENEVVYPSVTLYKNHILKKAFRKNKNQIKKDGGFLRFCQSQKNWLEDYALFLAFQAHFGGITWNRWPNPIRDRQKNPMAQWREKLSGRIFQEKFFQYLFFKQWKALKAYSKKSHIQIIGDLPIYVQYHSADVWSHPDIFNLGPKKDPLTIAGVPPDLFSSCGQLWNNPLFRWNILKKRNYDWWIQRIAHNLKLFDILRLDHFKGFLSYWEVSAKESTAANGRWEPGPGEDFFLSLLKYFPFLPLIVEDLGTITPDVHALRDRLEFPGMRVLQFAFGDNHNADYHKPSSYIKNCVAYSGTHDNPPFMGWLKETTQQTTQGHREGRLERKKALQYLGLTGKSSLPVHWEFIRLLMTSKANTVIIPMQDLLGLGSEARMNQPAKAHGNWKWRLLSRRINHRMIQKLSKITLSTKRDSRRVHKEP